MIDSNQKNEDDIDLLVSQVSDEFTSAIERGETPSIEEFARRYPRISDIIRNIFPAISKLSDHSAEEANREIPHQLGDFRIEAEIGRGGMGIVYRATQLSIARTVALKVLPFASTLDRTQLQRFKNEVRAAGAICHPNVVPVFAMGEERGVHFYAMQWINGQSLADVIPEIHRQCEVDLGNEPDSANADSPTTISNRNVDTVTKSIPSRRNQRQEHFRTIAKLGMQAAEALAHAHECGVIHRDIKPGNLMLDDMGKLWITDFGLARFDNSATVTKPGDLLGTIRYMSPEQAEGNLGLVDQRSDVYSLGVTLYEWVTLRPAIDGESREQILRNVRRCEPQSPRKLDPTVPIGLETIIRKAIEKTPSDRYLSARQMAEDLHRFLNHRPLIAKRANLAGQIRKWGKRNPRFVMTAGILSSVLAVMLAVATVLIDQEKVKTEIALDAEQQQRRRADENLKMARETIHRLYIEQTRQLDDQPGMTPTQRRFLEEAVHFYERLPKTESGSATIQQEAAQAHRRLANVLSRLGRNSDAIGHYRKAIEINSRITGEFPECFLAIAHSRLSIGDMFVRQRALPAAVDEFELATEALRSIPKNADDDVHFQRKMLITSLDRSMASVAEKRGDLGEARRLLEKSANEAAMLCADKSISEHVLYDLILIQINYASFLFREFGDVSAESTYRSTLEQADRLRQANPGRVLYKSLVAGLQHELAVVLQQKGNVTESVGYYRTSIEMRRQMAQDFPHRPDYQEKLAEGFVNLGGLLHNNRQFDQAVTCFEHALSINQRLIERYPESSHHREDRASYISNLGNSLEKVGRTDESRQWRMKLVEQWKSLAQSYPEQPTYRAEFAMAKYSLANTLEPAVAIDWLQQSVQEMSELVATHPNKPSYLSRLSSCQNSLALNYVDLQDFLLAEEMFVNALQTARQLHDRWPETPDHRAKIARRLRHLGNLRLRMNRFDEAGRDYREAIQIRNNMENDFPEYRKSMYATPLASLHVLLGSSIVRHGNGVSEDRIREADKHFRVAVELAMKARSMKPMIASLRGLIGEYEMNRVLFHASKQFENLIKPNATDDNVDSGSDAQTPSAPASQ